ncbi:hypothetical protein [Rhizobium giardinii]|uniref:hypothetical protein n=1 Tax=Rhizobium giardinii TaxID=56731 RepID=UPI003D6F926A
MTESATRDIVGRETASAIALHEAAHCVAAVGHGIGVTHVSLDECEVGLQSPDVCIERGHHYGAIAIGFAITALAGRAAAPETGLSKSDELLLQNAFFLGSWADPPDEMRRAFSVLAAHFVLEHRGQIEELAVVLDQRRNMSGAEVQEFLGSVGR